MTQYIDKSALVAEIKHLVNTYKKCSTRNSYEKGLKDGRLIGYEDALLKINAIEVKEVDLEKEADECWNYVFSALGWDENSLMTMDYKEFMAFAKHFFELGMRVSNKEKKGE